MKRKNNRQPIHLGTIILIIVTICTFSVAAFYVIKYATKNRKPYDDFSSSNNQSTTDSNIDTKNNNVKAVESSKIHEGNLILVNSEHAFALDEPTNMVNALENANLNPKYNYYVKDNTVNVDATAFENFVAMAEDFHKAKDEDNFMLISGYRSKEYQKKLYDRELKRTGLDTTTLVAIPGYSEHQTSLAVDFGIFPNGGVQKTYNGKGKFSWITENCYKYGFIKRYSANKKSITKISEEAWHYRYVGKPHAFLIKNFGYCFEEYIDHIKQYTVDKPLKTDGPDSGNYEIYYVAKTPDTTNVPVPADKKYTISGNNVDGFIVTVDCN